MTDRAVHESFEHSWTAEILPGRPLILPRRQYVYPNAAEEVERGALEVMVRPRADSGHEPFLATFALGFRDPLAPTGVWAMPNPEWLCAVSGGYAYCVHVMEPERFVFLRYRPVLQVLTYAPENGAAPEGLILFVGHYSVLAWGRDGEAWESDRLSWEGVTELKIEAESTDAGTRNVLRGMGWDLIQDREIPFTVDLATGQRV
ncbi:hypothetical protein ACFPT7_02915 [Acidicapsa dinghuensis]|uniref:Uncharacterized protein n=1 Tax=Acidicapsa dinghuensis TaxID=2218256 RepID=A0ABW1EE34_9BACT|nr:hypothetical protein [Acidicapsa dinghuensis]